MKIFWCLALISQLVLAISHPPSRATYRITQIVAQKRSWKILPTLPPSTTLRRTSTQVPQTTRGVKPICLLCDDPASDCPSCYSRDAAGECREIFGCIPQ